MTTYESEADEQILVATMLSVTNTDPEILDRLPAEHFSGIRALIWDTARGLRSDGRSTTPRNIAAKHPGDGTLSSALSALAGQAWPVARVREAERTVVDLARFRRLQGALTAAQERMAAADDYSDALEAAHAELNRLDESLPPAAVRTFDDVFDTWWDNLTTPTPRRVAIPTPWSGLDDKLAGGLHRGRTYVVGGRPGEGKAAALDTPIPTPNGWTTMDEIRPGDHVYDEHGQSILVTWESQVWTDRTCYRVTFDDGSSVVVDGEHEWLTDTRQSRKVLNNPTTDRESPFGRDQRWKSAKAEVRTTREIADTLRVGKENRLNHSIATVSAPLKGSDVTSPIDPYVLGVWLGDGYSRSAQFISADIEIVDEVRRRGYRAEPVSGKYHYSMAGDGAVMSALRALDLYRNKHIPAHFMRATEEFRMDLVRGLMDTDGTADTYGRVELTLCNKTLAMDAVELIRTFGWKVHVKESAARLDGKDVGRRWRIKFSPDQIVFHLPRKANRQSVDRRATTRRWYITDVQEVPSVPTKCIEVDSGSHLYLIGETMVPTHNSIAGVNLATHAAENGHSAVVFSVEMGEHEVASRSVASGARAEYGQITRRHIDDHNLGLIAEWADTNRSMPLRLVDKADIGVEYVAAVCRSIKRAHGLDVVFVDYLQLLKPAGSKIPRQQQIADMSRALKVLAMDLDVAVVIACQLNRNSANEKRAPVLADLRESGAIEQDCDVAILLHHPRGDDGGLSGDVELVVAKNRTGALGVITCRWTAYQARIA